MYELCPSSCKESSLANAIFRSPPTSSSWLWCLTWSQIPSRPIVPFLKQSHSSQPSCLMENRITYELSFLWLLLMIDNDYDADLQEDGSRDSNRAVCTCRKSFQLLSPCSRTALLNWFQSVWRPIMLCTIEVISFKSLNSDTKDSIKAGERKKRLWLEFLILPLIVLQ